MFRQTISVSSKPFGPPSILFKTFDSADAMQYDCADLGKLWDSVESIRERVRNQGCLVEHKTPGKDATVAQCAQNYDVLTPLLHRLLTSQNKLPEIQPLRVEVDMVYKACQRQVDDSIIDDDAWEIRKMMRFVKRKAQRKAPSLVVWL